ncbi:MAG: hypothetical protein MUP81_05720 [Dehalococcoidia bacterium]|nr:hypothetical protein [Dehalococcoidia bacterium]
MSILLETNGAANVRKMTRTEWRAARPQWKRLPPLRWIDSYPATTT